jgi:hypothetical protein
MHYASLIPLSLLIQETSDMSSAVLLSAFPHPKQNFLLDKLQPPTHQIKNNRSYTLNKNHNNKTFHHFKNPLD